MAISTAGNLITAASNKVGIQSPTPTQNAEALDALNTMISFWGTEGLNYVVTSETLAITAAGGAEYTVGSGGDLNTVRPVSLESCFLRDSEGFDWPVKKMSSEGYNTITDKDVSTRPTKVYFLPEFPLAKVIFNSVPDTSYTAYFEFNKGFAAFASTTATLGATFPNENLEGVIYNLAVAIGENWDRKISPTVMYRAKETKDALDSRNAANKPVPKAKFDFTSGRTYNISTDY